MSSEVKAPLLFCLHVVFKFFISNNPQEFETKYKYGEAFIINKGSIIVAF